MRITLDIPKDLLDEARRLLGSRSRNDTVVLALRELVRRKRIEEIKEALGTIRLELDVPSSRRRPSVKL